MYFGRRFTTGRRLLDSQEHAIVVEPISIVDDIAEDEEDAYEEMDEEEEEDCPTSSATIPVMPCTEVEVPEASGSFASAPPHCIVCNRTPTPKTRLFRWPDDQQLRRSWLAFFHMEPDYLDGCKDPYICNVHFDASQFLYEGDHVYWRKDPFPKFRQRRSILADPFPWEVTISSKKQTPQEAQPYRMRHGIQHEHKVTFRESFFKSKSKSSHPVAVVSLPGNPNIFYEFSYTRTSAVDSSKFYSCLTCRKAKIDTRIKDVIRTIHIKDGTIRSRGDPFWGHHFACRPFTCVDDTDLLRAETNPNHLDDNAHHMQGVATALRKDSEWETRYAPYYTPESMGSSLPHQNDNGNHEVEGVHLSAGQMRTVFPSAANAKVGFLRQQRKIQSLPRCHLCRKILPSTKLLLQHLQRHIKSCPNCKLCGTKLSPDDSVRIRRTQTCLKCMRKMDIGESLLEKHV